MKTVKPSLEPRYSSSITRGDLFLQYINNYLFPLVEAVARHLRTLTKEELKKSSEESQEYIK